MPKLDSNDSKCRQALDAKAFTNVWQNSPTLTEVSSVLATASKTGSGHVGSPDYVNVNQDQRMLILAEFKTNVADHRCPVDGASDPMKFAVDGVAWYLERFASQNLPVGLYDFFSDWKIVGIAVSGDLADPYAHQISTLTLVDGAAVEHRQATELLHERDYLALFESIDSEAISARVSESSNKLNRLLRNLDSQKRPTLLAGCMVALFNAEGIDNSFVREFESNTPSVILEKLPLRVRNVLASERIPEEKSRLLCDQLGVMASEPALNGVGNSNILREILRELKSNVIPLFTSSKSNYDIIGKFYADFLKYAGIANVKNGIVLTPAHITELFTQIIDLKADDVILDTCCGTGSFLIAGMNALSDLINATTWSDKQERLARVKQKQLIGFENNPLMYSLAISSMLFRGDGKSQIFNVDSFSSEATAELQRLAHGDGGGVRPTVGFINPPYGGKDSDSNPTKKEIQFLMRTLDLCSRYVVMIAPLSTYFQDAAMRKQILERHTLRRVINMPRDLFQPNAATNTAVAVFETNRPHIYSSDSVMFYDLSDDGFRLAKGRGRSDLLGRWSEIRKNLLAAIKDPSAHADGHRCVYTTISPSDEWIIQDHSTVDYSALSDADFEASVRRQMIFNAKQRAGLLGSDVDEIELLSVVSAFYAEDGQDG